MSAQRPQASPAVAPELLAPAGEPRALRAALAAGADAVYFGLERWSARAFAGNFAGDAAVAAVGLAHRWGARVYLALNTLLKDDEVEPALAALEAPYRAGLDALIVTDLGFATMVRDQYPGLALHASTQLNTHSSSQLAVLSRLGFARAVLARELSLGEIAALDPHGLELEVFVHGALCYGYSGDCLLSSMVGGRSGNRGRCSQSCRMKYAVRPAREEGRGDARELPPARVLSTSDLAAIGVLPELIAAGVTSLKIEGRMKDAAYVGVTTAVYREALDAAMADPRGFRVRPEWSSRLEQSFSRGFTTAHLEGRHHAVRSGGRSGHRGVLVGRVTHVDDDRGEVQARLTRPLAEGDVVCLYTSWGQSEPIRVERDADEVVTLRLRERVAVKDRLFRIAATEVDELARDLIAGRAVVRPTPLGMTLAGGIGEPLRLTVQVKAGPHAGDTVTIESQGALAPARTVALDEERARAALGALGGTPYALADLRVDLQSAAFVPVSELKGLRRRAVATLDERHAARRPSGRHVPPGGPGGGAIRPVTAAAGPPGGGAIRRATAAAGRPTASAPPGGVVAGSAHDAPVVLAVRVSAELGPTPEVAAFCLDVAPGDALGAVEAARTRLVARDVPVRLRLPEVLFDADGGWLRAVLGMGWDGVHARHLGVLQECRGAGLRVVLEYPLQGLDSLTAGMVTGLCGHPPAAVVASPEASLAEIAGLAVALGRLDSPPALEVMAFGRQQVLHTRDQLGRAEGLYDPLGPERHTRLLLEDARGYVFPVDVDAAGSRIGNARVTNLARQLGDLGRAGVASFLVFHADMTADERAAFAAGGLPALASFASRERSTTGHLFRGVP